MSPQTPCLSPLQERAKRRSLLALLIMLIGSVGLDQASKIAAEQHLMVWTDANDLRQYQGRRLPVWSGGEWSPSGAEDPSFYLAFNLNYVRNQGAAWGALSDLDDRLRVPFFYGVTFLAALVIAVYLRSTPLSHRLARFALGLILSGALGNFLDRLQRGYVIDFLDFRWVIPLPFTLSFEISSFPAILDFFNGAVHMNAWHYNFPNFNWADSAITVGVGFLIYDMLILEYLRKKRVTAAHPPQEARAKLG